MQSILKRARVVIGHHELDKDYYRVPHRLVRAKVKLRIARAMIETMHKRRVEVAAAG